MTKADVTDWGVLHRIAQDTEDHFFLRLRVTGVPVTATKQEIKEALERAGRTHSEGPYLWGNHSIVPQKQWPEKVRQDYTTDGADSITHDDLLDEAKGEKRVTLRLPIGLHAILVKAAGEKSFNQFCVDTLSASVGYGDALPDYLPLLAQHNGQTEEKMRERLATAQADVARRAAASDLNAERMRKMQALFQAIGSRTAADAKDIYRAMLTPDKVQSIVAATKELIDIPDDQIEKKATEMGISGDELRAKIAQMRAVFTPEYQERMAAIGDTPAEIVQANFQYLAEAYRPAAP